LFDAPNGALVGGIERTDTFDLVAEKVEPERMTLARRK
jgi:hypothetical protein